MLSQVFGDLGPFTTGMLTIIQPLALGGIQAFTLTGSDNRVSGVGSISLVAGGLSNRFISGPGTARSWSNLTIGAPLGALPSMNGVGAGLIWDPARKCVILVNALVDVLQHL